MKTSTIKKASLIIRHATIADINAIDELVNKRVYPDFQTWPLDCIASQVQQYPEGQFVAIFEGKMVAYSASIRISGALALQPHTWDGITGNGYATTHDPNGDYLYGMEICVDPEFRNHHIGHRIYNERKKLCTHLHLKGIITGGRLASLSKEIKQVKTPENYIEQVQLEKIHDRALLFQLHNGFEVIGVLKDYLPDDKQSLGYASHLIWHNPEIVNDEHHHVLHRRKHHFLAQDHVRVATVQYEQRKLSSFEEFVTHVDYFIRVVAEYRTDFVVFPELFTMQLLSIDNKDHSPDEAIAHLATYTERYKAMMTEFAVSYNINIIGGSTATKVGDHMENMAYIFLRDGSIHTQAKIHPTPDERQVWHMTGDNQLNHIMTDCGPIGVLICYDSEFPELARHLIDQGMYILFVPFCTDQRSGYLRIRYCAQARAVENQCYVVISGNVGNLPGVQNMNVQYAQSCVLTPSDFPFAHDGIAADTPANVETIAFADLNIKSLIAARNTGSVINLQDRRKDLYRLEWLGDK
jgi:predicted amidohydrolase/GNAT superfamily N-acetyltransferase